MKKCVFLVLAMLLIASVPALCEAAEPIAAGSVLTIDLDGDGAEEAVSWEMVPDEYEEHLTLTVVTAEGAALSYPTEIISSQAVYAADLDGDGRAELLLTGDVMSDDYYTWCLHLENGALHEVLFPDAERGDNTDGYFKYGYGMITALGDGALTLSGSQDSLGTWFASRTMALTPWERFEFSDAGLWVRDISDEDRAWDYAALTVKTALHYTDEQGNEGVLEPGDRILVQATDKRERVWFATPDGVRGSLAIMPDYERGWGLAVDGIPEDDCFDHIWYAD